MEGPHIKELLNYWSRKFYHEHVHVHDRG
jgi:hypothetical protein